MKTKFNFYLDKVIREKLNSLASGHGVSVSFLINVALSEFVNNDLSTGTSSMVETEKRIISDRIKAKNKIPASTERSIAAEELKQKYFEATSGPTTKYEMDPSLKKMIDGSF